MLSILLSRASAMPGPPPRATMPAGEVHQIVLEPVFRRRFICAEHPAGELAFPADAPGEPTGDPGR